MALFYTDTETTGLDAKKDELIAVSFQEIDITTGKTAGPLRILKSWEKDSNEKQIVKAFAPLVTADNPFKFVMVGNNLNFDFHVLVEKINKHLDTGIDLSYFHCRPYIDLKHLLILLNGGRFKGYHKILSKQNGGAMVPYWYKNSEYEKITEYIKREAFTFTAFYSKIHELMFDSKIRSNIINSMNRRLDEYV